MSIEHFSPLKKSLQRLGSWVVRQASQTDVPDTTSGFRAYNREAAIQMRSSRKFTYTLETIIQAGKMLVAVDHVPIRTNPKTRESRLFPSMWSYVRRNSVSIFRIYAPYEPLRVFMTRPRLVGAGRARHLGPLRYFYIVDGTGRPRPVADPRRGAVQRRRGARRARRDRRPARAQRTLSQRTFERVRRVELAARRQPCHYEPGAHATGEHATTGAARAERRARPRTARP
jgi:hypothetical protein